MTSEMATKVGTKREKKTVCLPGRESAKLPFVDGKRYILYN